MEFGTWKHVVWEKSEGVYILAEADYDEDGNLCGCYPANIMGNSVEKLQQTLGAMYAATEQPIIPHDVEFKQYDLENAAKMTKEQFEEFVDVLNDNQDLDIEDIKRMANLDDLFDESDE